MKSLICFGFGKEFGGLETETDFIFRRFWEHFGGLAQAGASWRKVRAGGGLKSLQSMWIHPIFHILWWGSMSPLGAERDLRRKGLKPTRKVRHAPDTPFGGGRIGSWRPGNTTERCATLALVVQTVALSCNFGFCGPRS